MANDVTWLSSTSSLTVLTSRFQKTPLCLFSSLLHVFLQSIFSQKSITTNDSCPVGGGSFPVLTLRLRKTCKQSHSAWYAPSTQPISPGGNIDGEAGTDTQVHVQVTTKKKELLLEYYVTRSIGLGNMEGFKRLCRWQQNQQERFEESNLVIVNRYMFPKTLQTFFFCCIIR